MPTCAGYQFPAAIFCGGQEDQEQRWLMSSKKGGAGFFVPEDVWNEFEELIGIAQAFSSVLDGPERSIVVSSHSLHNVARTLSRRLGAVRAAARFQGESHAAETEDGSGE